jgi:hypothetical protein
MNRLVLYLAAIAVVLSTAPVGAADSPWDGTWKLNEAKSILTGDTVTYSKAPNGLIEHSDATATSYSFGCDGKDYPTLSDRSIVCTKAGDTVYIMTFKAAGKTMSVSRRVLSNGDKTLTMTARGKRPDGTPFTAVDVYHRVSGTSGLYGKWRNVKSSDSAPSLMVISLSGDSLNLAFPGFKQHVNARLDGSETVPKGDQIPPGFTVWYKANGPTRLTYGSKFHGKPFYTGTMSVSADGKTITDISWPAGTPSEKETDVYDKE